jgi:type IV secretion system protein VirB4
MNPLQMPDTPENRTFLKKWLERLLLRSGEQDLPSAQAEIINECIDYSFEQLEPSSRTLSHISRYFPVNFDRWPELRRWMKGDEHNAAGEFGWLFDNQSDSLELGFDKVGFDVTYLMDEVSSTISTPVYMYIVHRMRQCLDGRLTSFVFDEAWQILNDPFWVNYLKSALPTIRKLNGHFIFMTQSPETVVHSPVRSILMDNAATLIYFPNPQANESVYIDALKLTQAEYQTIRNNTADSRLFLYKQGHESMLCKLDLGELRDELRVFSGNKKSVRLLDSILMEAGNDPDIWLPIFLDRSKA